MQFQSNLIRNTNELNKKFIEYSLQISEFASLQKIKITPFNNFELPIFNNLPECNQFTIVSNLEVYRNICEKITLELGSNSDFSQSIWIALKSLELVPSSDLFNYLKVNRIVEIHNLDGQQMFRNLYFFKFCSYTLEELYCIPWIELFDRPPENTKQMIDFVHKMSKVKLNQTHVITEIDPHITIESKSKYKMCLNYKPLYYSPLFSKDGEVIAGLAIEEAETLQTLVNHENEFDLKSDDSKIEDNLFQLFN